MTTPEEIPDPATDEPPATETPPPVPDPADDTANRQAARYRRRLRETEAARDLLAAQVDRLRTREAERLAAEHLAQAEDLWTVGNCTLTDVLDDDGDVDAQKVADAAGELLAARPGLARIDPAKWPDMGQGARGQIVATGGRGWAEVIGDAVKRR